MLYGIDIFDVKKGDRYGISCLNGGVIKFDDAIKDNFCESSEIFNVGDKGSLYGDRYGHRKYSIRLQFVDCPVVCSK